MKKRIDRPIGELVDKTTQPDGSVIETYEVEILGSKIRYFHIPEYEPEIISWVTNKPFDIN